jgi:drug/metabolite transporter (DMT)-like permease
MFAFANFLIASASYQPEMAREVSLIGGMFYSFVYFGIKIGKNYSNRKHSEIPLVDLTKISFSVILCLIFSGLLATASGYSVAYAFKYATCSGVNQGIISTFFSFTSVFASIAAWFVFNERISIYHMIGMGTMLMSINLLTLLDDDTGKKLNNS